LRAVLASAVAFVAAAGCGPGGGDRSQAESQPIEITNESGDAAEAAGLGWSGGADVDGALLGSGEAAPRAPLTPLVAAPVSGAVRVLWLRPEPPPDGLTSALRARHGNLSVEFRGGAADEKTLLGVLAASPPPDLVVVRDASLLDAAVSARLLRALPAAALDRVSERFRGGEGHWVSVGLRARIAVVRRLSASKPLSALDLSEPRFRGKLALPSLDDPSFVDGIATLLAARGERSAGDVLRGVFANQFPEPPGDDARAIGLVSVRSADAAFVDHDAWYRSILASPSPDDAGRPAESIVAESRLEPLFLDDTGAGVAAIPSAAAIPAAAPHVEAALAVLDVLLSPEGQRAFSAASWEFPVLGEVAPADGLPATDSFHWTEAERASVAEQRPRARAMLAELRGLAAGADAAAASGALGSAPSSRAWPWLRADAALAAEPLSARLFPPPGFERVPVEPGSFGAFLRDLPLRPAGAEVHYHDGRRKPYQAAQWAVVDLDVGEDDLQQCADAVIRLRAEWLWAAGRSKQASFRFTSGDACPFDKWSRGLRPVVAGDSVGWAPLARSDESHASYRAWLDKVFQYAGTLSLAGEMKRVAVAELAPGDVFLHPGSPGHAVLVADVARDAAGTLRFVLVQSYTPAQDAHVLRVKDHDPSPWFPLPSGSRLPTPEWEFGTDELYRFPP
jgi:ABC-type Fe3+ transport system substrate-binding protein